ncbi:MAG: histidine phosphatase family protein [Candidatus Nanohaloarchaea archaeon]
MRAVLVRHGEKEHNRKDSITGQMDVEITENGREQARKVSERFADRDFEKAYSSDLRRTSETIEIISDENRIEKEKKEDLRERDFGILEGKPIEDYRRMEGEFDGEKHLLRPENGESLMETGERIVGFLDRLRNQHDRSSSILIGAHSVATKAALMVILDGGIEIYRKLETDNASITELEYDEIYGWKITRLNDTAHLG